VALETVVLTVHGGAGAAAASAVAPLLRSDLPTVLWWPGAPGGESQDDLDALATVADRVVTESGRAPIAATAVRALAGWVPAAAPAVTDLSWAAITGWRQLIAQMVEGEALEALRATDSEAVVAHASPEPCADSLLLAAWLTEVAGPRLIARTEARDDGGGGGIVACELTSGRGRRLAVERAPGRHAAAVIVTEPDGSSRRRVLPLPRPDRAELLAGELELQRRDRRFEETLAAAARGGLL
jgi:glucose-6-phosphate dehydrogenase assembly protein OpcA